MERPHPKRTFGRRLGGAALILAITWAVCEVAASLAFAPMTGGPYAPGEDLVATSTRSADRAGREAAGLGFRDPAMVVHPYLGYVYQPRDPGAPPGRVPISQDGFLDVKRAVRAREASKVIVGIVGGSVAGQLGTIYDAQLTTALSTVPSFAGKTVDVVRLGMPGYHQPQQVIQIAYLLARGGELDYLVNLDGFNEIAVPGALNVPKGAHPLYPMNWSMVALDTPDPQVRRLVGAIAYLREHRARTRDRFVASAWSVSRIARLRWRLEDLELERELAALAWQLQSLPTGEVPYFVSGPREDHDPPGGLLKSNVEVWFRGSRHLAALAKVHGIRYVHVLQPNQYLPGSKRLTAEEKTNAFEDDSPYRPIIEEGYPMFRARAAQLEESGIRFVDLSQLFANVAETVYKDNCCHYNELGNRLLAEAIAKAISNASTSAP